jgi:hypothetical protein
MTSSALTSMHARWRGCRNDGRRFYEPGFEELLDRALATGRLRFLHRRRRRRRLVGALPVRGDAAEAGEYAADLHCAQ